MKKIFFLLLIFFLSSCASLKTLDPDNLLPKSSKKHVVRHEYYTLRYNEKNEEADWVAYKLLDEYLENNFSRKDDFRIDPFVKTGSASPDDYKYSGYDRGHLCPAADMKFSKQALSDTFFMSNISPQDPNFNRDIWNELEEKVRKWVKKEKELYIVTGPIIEKDAHTIGDNHVAVPTYFYKIILDYTGPEIKAIAFIIPNKNPKDDLTTFAVSIDDVEKRTGLNFFNKLPNKIEKDIEKNFDILKWDGLE